MPALFEWPDTNNLLQYCSPIVSPSILRSVRDRATGYIWLTKFGSRCRQCPRLYWNSNFCQWFLHRNPMCRVSTTSTFGSDNRALTGANHNTFLEFDIPEMFTTPVIQFNIIQ
jgi:hypothetical protein